MCEAKSKASDASSTASGPLSTAAASTSTSTAEAAPAAAAAQFADHVRSFNSLFTEAEPKPRPSSRPTGHHVFRRSDLNAMLVRLDALEQGLSEWKRTTREHMKSAGAELNMQRFRQDRVDGDYPRLVGYIAEIRRETAHVLNNHTEALRTHRALLEELRREVRQRDEAFERAMRWIAAAQRTGRLPVPQGLMAPRAGGEGEGEAQAEGGVPDSRGPN
ncbi:hypothetical protein ESCO_003477 [Escovopsis weberi]|uniref:Uncharacterized protein n=1 Tax=Escovopsis weberi TaxID=150374 RepID=A0A0M8N4U1_ESCWE|nr:hypothetical protein ESCO_003477 [Escovopsis weberi]